MQTDVSTTSPWTFGGESSRVGDGSITLVDGTTFIVCGASGDIGADSVEGLFMLDTRVLSIWRLLVNGQRVEPLSVSPDGPFSATFVGRVHDPEVVDAPITVIQRRHVGQGMREDLEIRNYAATPVSLRVELVLGSDFGSLFDVKAERARGAHPAAVTMDGSIVRLVPPHDAEPRAVQATIATFTANPARVGEGVLGWEVELGAGESWTNCVLVGVAANGSVFQPAWGCGEPIGDAIPISRLRQWHERVTAIETDSSLLGGAARRASEDLGALRIFDPDHPERVVVAAGAPWFMTLFGRDSLLASWMALLLEPDLCIGVLRELADAQGRRLDPATEEQPGRILHEVRFDSASSRLLGGSNTYFGAVDATPLFVMTVAELARWTGITSTIVELMPAVDRAVAWIDRYGDRDGDGFVEYLRSDPRGLEHQGWKDSWDGVRHLDGSVARGPIALCEVQGYVHAAYRSRAELGRALGEPAAITDAHDARADALRDAFDASFWMADHGWYAIGLDGEKRQIGSLTSNIGHLLWTGIVPERRAGALAARLVDGSMFSGWGVRTLAEGSAGYNPLSYHNGSVWPHDTAIAVAGLARYGYDDEARQIAAGLLAASAHSGGRLPELFAGFARDDLPAPVPYPASCSPQAWAAAAPLLLIRALLGLEPNLLAGRVGLRPRLPDDVGFVRLRNVQIGGRDVTVTATHDSTEVTGLGEDVRVEIDAG